MALGHRPLVAATATCALLLAWPVRARGQTCPNITIAPSGVVPRYYPGGDMPANLYPVRPSNLNPTSINYKDCKDDIVLEFTLSVSNLPCSDTIQVWAGTTDCSATAARQANSGSPQCWQVAPPGTFAMATESTGNIRARDIVAFMSNSEAAAATNGQYQAQGIDACRAQYAPGTVSMSLYFMAVDATGDAVDGNVGVYALGADLLGPYPPTSVTAGVGENLIVVNWASATDSTIQGFNIYCQRQGGATDGAPDVARGEVTFCPDTGLTRLTDAASDAATFPGDACVSVNVIDGGGSGGAACTSDVLVDEFVIDANAPTTGEGGTSTAPLEGGTSDVATPLGVVGISDIPGQYLCGQVGGNTATGVTVTAFDEAGTLIQDGTTYAVAVAAVDGTGNVGILGPLACVVPSPVDDFWTAYNQAGGLSGGGFCALEAPGVPVSGGLFALGMGALGMGGVRRRRGGRGGR